MSRPLSSHRARLTTVTRFCKPCIDFSSSPENPRPPRQPLVTTLKKPRKARTTSGSLSPAKRARLSPALPPPPVTNGAATAGDAPAERRPKRKAALDRPDYYNMHHHNATPTKGWLDLIKDPAKHGRVIKEGGFGVRGAVLTHKMGFLVSQVAYSAKSGSSPVKPPRTWPLALRTSLPSCHPPCSTVLRASRSWLGPRTAALRLWAA